MGISAESDSVRSPYRRALKGAAAGLVAVLMLSACGPSDEELRAQQLASPVTPAWESEETLLSDVERAGGMALAYVAEDDQMYLVARDVKTGEEVWKYEALAGNASEGSVPSVAVVEREGAFYVAYYSTSDSGPGIHKVRDVATGEQIDFANTTWAYSGHPRVCGGTFCASGTPWSPTARERFSWGDHGTLEFDWEQSQWGPQTSESRDIPLVSEDASLKGSNLSISGADDDEELVGYGRDGELLWKREFSEIFGDELRLEDYMGTTGDSEEFPLVYANWRPGEERKSGEDTVTIRDLTDAGTTVGLDRETGETLWEAPGLLASCRGMGATFKNDGDTFIGCGYAAGERTETETPDGESDVEYEGDEAYAIAVDSQTGEELWRRDIGPRPEDSDEDDPLDALWLTDTSNLGLWDRDGERVYLDARTGEDLEVGDIVDDVGLCDGEHEDATVQAFNAEDDFDWSKGGDQNEVGRYGWWFPCTTSDAQATETTPTLAELRRLGFDEEDYVVLPDEDGMVAYAVSGAEES